MCLTLLKRYSVVDWKNFTTNKYLLWIGFCVFWSKFGSIFLEVLQNCSKMNLKRYFDNFFKVCFQSYLFRAFFNKMFKNFSIIL